MIKYLRTKRTADAAVGKANARPKVRLNKQLARKARTVYRIRYLIGFATQQTVWDGYSEESELMDVLDRYLTRASDRALFPKLRTHAKGESLTKLYYARSEASNCAYGKIFPTKDGEFDLTPTPDDFEVEYTTEYSEHFEAVRRWQLRDLRNSRRRKTLMSRR